MAFYNKSDLIYTDYKWSAYPDDDPKVTGKPDSTLLDKHEGYEVLYFINKIAEEYNFKQKYTGIKIETMIREQLPSDIRSQEKILVWLSNNWEKF